MASLGHDQAALAYWRGVMGAGDRLGLQAHGVRSDGWAHDQGASDDRRGVHQVGNHVIDGAAQRGGVCETGALAVAVGCAPCGDSAASTSRL